MLSKILFPKGSCFKSSASNPHRRLRDQGTSSHAELPTLLTSSHVASDRKGQVGDPKIVTGALDKDMGSHAELPTILTPPHVSSDRKGQVGGPKTATGALLKEPSINGSNAECQSISHHTAASMENVACPIIGPDHGRFPMLRGSYDWIRSGNSAEERRLRIEGARATTAACKRGEYIFQHIVNFPSRSKEAQGQSCSGVPLQRIQDMLRSTCIVRASDVMRHTGSNASLCVLHAPSDDAIAVGLACARAGQRVGIVNAASAYHVGGGFQTGGRHALEEALNMQSTIFQSLALAQQLATQQGVEAPRCANPQYTRSGRPWDCHIPEDGVVLSPHVEVFRQDAHQGYPFMRIPVELAAILSVAMPNFNARVKDAPCDYPATEQEYYELIEKKFTALLGAASVAGVDVLVMPAVGCGVYQNRADLVGHIFGDVLRRGFPGVFKEIHLLGSSDFTSAAVAATANPQ